MATGAGTLAGREAWGPAGRSAAPPLASRSRRLPLSSAVQWVSHVGTSSRPGLRSTTVTLIGAQGNSEGAVRPDVSPPLHQPELRFPCSVKCQGTGLRQAF